MLSTPLQYLADREPLLADLIAANPNCSMGPEGQREVKETYPYLFRVILFQQLAGKAASAIFEGVKNYFGGDIPEPEVVFHTPAHIFRDLGVGAMKTSYLQGLAESYLVGELPSYNTLLTMSDEEIHKSLQKLRGIGPWTVDMLLMFNLGREDVMPTLDYALQRGFAKLCGCPHPSPRELSEKTAHWSPYRSYGAWYLWELADQNDDSSSEDLW